MKTLFSKTLTIEDRALINIACCKVIDLLHTEMKLEKWQCLLTVKTLYEDFPLEDLKEQGTK